MHKYDSIEPCLPIRFPWNPKIPSNLNYCNIEHFFPYFRLSTILVIALEVLRVEKRLKNTGPYSQPCF